MDNIQITKKTKPIKTGGERKNLAEAIKTLKKGQCLEYRGPLHLTQARQIAAEATQWLEKKYSGRAVEGGIDIFCE